jgi:hypothetical protein
LEEKLRNSSMARVQLLRFILDVLISRDLDALAAWRSYELALVRIGARTKRTSPCVVASGLFRQACGLGAESSEDKQHQAHTDEVIPRV